MVKEQNRTNEIPIYLFIAAPTDNTEPSAEVYTNIPGCRHHTQLLVYY